MRRPLIVVVAVALGCFVLSVAMAGVVELTEPPPAPLEETHWLCVAGADTSASVDPFPGARVRLEVWQTEECGYLECHPKVDVVRVVTRSVMHVREPGQLPCAYDVQLRPRDGALCSSFGIVRTGTRERIVVGDSLCTPEAT